MRKLVVFNQVSLDGYFSGTNGDLSWADRDSNDKEWDAFVADNASGGSGLLFGRITYEMMVSYWPTPQAMANDPAGAEGTNRLRKVVVSRTLDKPTWTNTTLLKGDLVSEIRKLKAESGDAMVILGSGSLVSQLAQQALIDEYQLVVNPIVLGKGRTLFEGVRNPQSLALTRSQVFANGNVLLCYQLSAI